VPAVLILHGSGGIDGRGAYYAKALQDAGIATLEITMFAPGGRPRSGTKATMPFAAAALRWLAAQSEVDGTRLGVMGLSWGGVMTLLMSSELTQNALGKDVPKPIAFAPLYPTCSVIARVVKNRQSVFYGAETRMSSSPMLIQVGTKDDYEDDEHACDALVASWPAASRERTTCAITKARPTASTRRVDRANSMMSLPTVDVAESSGCGRLPTTRLRHGLPSWPSLQSI
jgi:dienelactone hydrolase